MLVAHLKITFLHIHDLEGSVLFHYYFIVNRVVMSGLMVSVASCETEDFIKSS